MSSPSDQEKFIKETIEKVYNKIEKFIFQPKDYYSSSPLIIHLKNQLEEYQSKMIKQEKNNKRNQFLKQRNINENLLPLLNTMNNPDIRIPNSSLFSQKITNKNLLKGFQDINKIQENDNKKYLRTKKKQLNINTNTNLYMDKYYKFNNDIKNRNFFHPKIYDKYNNAIIRNKDVSLGIYDMNVKKLIPKGADVTLAMTMWGNPIKIMGKEVKNTYKKCSSKDDVATGQLNRIKPSKFNLKEFYKTQPVLSIANTNSKSILNKTNNSFSNKINYSFSPYNTSNTIFSKYKNVSTNNKDNNNVFITEDSQLTESIKSRKTFSNLKINDTNFETNNKNEKNIKANTFYDILNQNKFCYINNNTDNSSQNKNSEDFGNNYNYTNLNSNNRNIPKTKTNFNDYIKNINLKNNLIIKYYYFELIIDEDFKLFKEKNEKNWKKINNILANFNILFEKLNINKAYIDSNKILKLIEFYHGNTKNITNKDLIMCLSKSDLKEKGYDPDNDQILYGKIKEAFIIRIQKAYRKRLAIKKYKEIKYLNKSIIIIQKNIKGYLIRKKVLFEIENNRPLIHDKYKEIFNKFKNDYDEIQSGPRIEIHINSLSYHGNYNNCLTEKYPMKETLQLSRLIRLVDPKVEIIYIIPYELPEEIISYYYSILENIGINNLEKRVHFIIPEAAEYLPLNYSLSKLLVFSNRSLMEIKRLVFNKKCYIIPGIPGDIEEKLSVDLNIPILMSPKSQIDLIFNKSGAKSLFEINEIPFPISAWNIITEEEFYSSLAHLIATYPNIKIWVFKGNLDVNATGIAYLNTDKIDLINQLRNEKKNNKKITTEKFEEKIFLNLKNILIKNISFAYPNLYKNWKDYLNHFLENKGIIECCPTKDLNGIMGRPCLPILIEPNGKVKILPSFEKINIDYFKNVICTSPQKCLKNEEMRKLGDKIGTFLYSQGIIGYITLDYITFHDGKKVLYWCVDMKYGYTQTICDIQYCYFLYAQSILQKDVFNRLDNFNEENKNCNINIDYNSESFNINYKKEDDTNLINGFQNTNIISNIDDYLNEEKNYEKILSNSMVFSFHYISSNFIKEIKLKELLRVFRYNNIVYNTMKKAGIIFNLCDGLECGILGLCGVINLDEIEIITPELKLWRLIDESVSLLKDMIFQIKKEKVITPNVRFYHRINNNNERNDSIDLQIIINNIKKIVKEKEIEQEKEENRRKKLANSPFI